MPVAFSSRGQSDHSAAGVYVHIPFCRARCDYCHFLSSLYDAERARHYVRALIGEIRLWAAAHTDCVAPIDSIYLGGGTPGLLPPGDIAAIIDACRRLFPVVADCEITLEINPGFLTATEIAACRVAGVNRVSLGAQSFVDAELRAAGRAHDVAAIDAALAALAAVFDNVSLDLMLGLPGQTVASWRATLGALDTMARPWRRVLKHISVYMLELDENTPLQKKIAAGILFLPDDDTISDLYLETIATCERLGLYQYEISNFARPGFASRHNLKYWRRAPVYAFGLGSHAFDGRCRSANLSDMEEYFIRVAANRLPEAWRAVVSADQALEETFFLGLRLTEGVVWRSLVAREGERAIADFLRPRTARLREFCAAGLLQWDDAGMRLTRQGMLLSNEILQLFV